MAQLKQFCDGKKGIHNPTVIQEDGNAMRVLCKECQHQFIIRKDWRGAPENRSYSTIFRRDSIQGNHPLFYKIYPQYLHV